jgi:siroheme synthase (precorrin-2 oxidase/ferrochelatase)
LADGKIEHISKTYSDSDLDNAVLVIGATDNLDVNRHSISSIKSSSLA